MLYGYTLSLVNCGFLRGITRFIFHYFHIIAAHRNEGNIVFIIISNLCEHKLLNLALSNFA